MTESKRSAITSAATDREIRVAVTMLLRWDLRIASQTVSASVDHGVVTLSGPVDDCRKKLAAQQAALGLPGVRAVVNLIEVRPCRRWRTAQFELRTRSKLAGRSIMEPMAANWSAVLLRGLTMLGFSVFALLSPDSFPAGFVVAFGACALMSGALTLLSALPDSATLRPHWLLLAQGAVGVAAGDVTLLQPNMTLHGLLRVIELWAALGGALELGTALGFSTSVRRTWLQTCVGGLSLAFAATLMFGGLGPEPELHSLMHTTGWYALASGTLLSVFASRLRARAKHPLAARPLL